MSQAEVLELLNELGGVASADEIKVLAKKKYPDCALYTYISNRLIKLKNWGIIDKEMGGGKNCLES